MRADTRSSYSRRHRGDTVISSLLLAALTFATPVPGEPLNRPVATYSIVARDPDTGEMGVAVQSHWFSVGSSVTWAEAGVGAVATQSFIEASYGPLGLAAMKGGALPSEALDALLERDAHAAVRQVAFVDASGRVAAHTGAGCIPGAGHRTGKNYSVQANLMLTSEVPDAMARGYEAASGPLAERLVAALDAAQRAGGDIRGKQSAALLVVRGTATDKPWTDTLVDLRVDDDEHPLAELKRLLKLHRAYEAMNRGDEAMTTGDIVAAVEAYSEAERMFPNNDEFIFWHAVTLVGAGHEPDALPLFKRAFRANPSWMLLVPRLQRVGQLPDTEGLAQRILAVGPQANP